MKNTNPTVMTDFYKIGHLHQYPVGTSLVYSTWTPRMSRHEKADYAVAFGFQGFIKEFLIDYFNENFFFKPIAEIVKDYKRIIQFTLGNPDPATAHIEALHKLGYLPLKIKAVEEGTIVPIGTPMLTIENTEPEFFWLTNFLETIMSNYLWTPSNSATIATIYKRILTNYALKTVGEDSFVKFQGHDFSMRGMSSLQSAETSGAGHLLSFVGTDSIPAICYLERTYNADVEKELVGCSVNATEHSVMCADGKDNEFETYNRLITEVYPSGILSIVSDTWDLWKVITDTLVLLKDKIMARDGKVVVRPDSGDPVEIVCGKEVLDVDVINSWDPNANYYVLRTVDVAKVNGERVYPEYIKFKDGYFKVTIIENILNFLQSDISYAPVDKKEIPAIKGVVECLWDIFGGTLSNKNYKILDSHIGVIYGDAITTQRCEDICRRLAHKGFASTNMVYGIGSYTYQCQTRDSLGFALKSTYVEINGVGHDIFKDPITDSAKFKKSQYGRVKVLKSTDGSISYYDSVKKPGPDCEGEDLLENLFVDGFLLKQTSLSAIRKRLEEQLVRRI